MWGILYVFVIGATFSIALRMNRLLLFLSSLLMSLAGCIISASFGSGENMIWAAQLAAPLVMLVSSALWALVDYAIRKSARARSHWRDPS
jgi:hypothetical protein